MATTKNQTSTVVMTAEEVMRRDLLRLQQKCNNRKVRVKGGK